MENGLVNDFEIAQDKKKELISTSDVEEKKYQKYLIDLQDWEKERQKIIGSKDKEECLTYFKCEEEYLEQNLEADYNKVREERETKFKSANKKSSRN